MAASLFAHSGINSRKMFVEELHDGKSVCNRVCELWISRDSISCINMDVALLHHRLLSPCNKKRPCNLPVPAHIVPHVLAPTAVRPMAMAMTMTMMMMAVAVMVMMMIAR